MKHLHQTTRQKLSEKYQAAKQSKQSKKSKYPFEEEDFLKSPEFKIDWPDFTRLGKSYLSNHQHEQLIKATQGRIGLLSGLAGTGKTTTLAYLLKALPHNARVGMSCPTGMAAMRANKTMQERGFFNCQAMTSHRLLKPGRNGHDTQGWGFQHNATNPLRYNVIIVDEAPMTGTDMLACILEAVPTGALVLLQGDPEQLSPIGHGRPYLDMVKAGLPHGLLEEVWRNAGRIAEVCHAIRAGKQWESSERFDLNADYPENYIHVEARGNGLIVNLLQKSIHRMKERGFDPIRDAQVICPLRNKGPLSTIQINKFLQPILNPNGRQINNINYRIGDKVMCVRNGERSEEIELLKFQRLNERVKRGGTLLEQESKFMDENGVRIQDALDYAMDQEANETFVANGEVGIVEDIHDGDMIVRFPDRSNAIIFSLKDWKENIELAYATTCHKMQGSQAPLILGVVDSSYGASMVCSRAYHYTANSRPQEALITIGMKSTIYDHCRKVDIHNRETRLKERIVEWLPSLPSCKDQTTTTQATTQEESLESLLARLT